MAETSFPSQVSLVFLVLCMSSLQKERRKKFWTWLFSRVGRSSTTPSRNFTTSPKLSSYSSASISSTVANGDSGCTPGYTLNNSTSSGNRHGVFYVCLCKVEAATNGKGYHSTYSNTSSSTDWGATTPTTHPTTTGSHSLSLVCVASAIWATPALWTLPCR